MKISSVTLILLVCLVGCKKTASSGSKKDYTCECVNPGGAYATYTLHDTKEKAQAKCDEYNAEANSIPWSESNCSLK